MRTAIYARRSTNKSGQKETIENQIKICRRKAEELGLTIVDIKTDTSRGSDDNNRPEVKELISEAVKGKYECVIMKGVTRLYRKTSKGLELVEKLENNGVRVISIEEHFDSHASENRTGTGKLDTSRLTMYLMFAEQEVSKLADRIKFTQIEKAHQGEWNQAGSPPIGYSYNPETKKLKIDHTRSKIVELIFDLYIDGVGMRSISHHLNGDNKDGIAYPSPKGKRWSQYTIGFILRNPVYKGWVVYNKRSRTTRPYKNPNSIGKTDEDIYIGNDYNDKSKWIVCHDAHEAIIPADKFDAVQEIIKSKGIRKGIRNNTSLLAGIAKCGKCGKGLTFKRGNLDKNGRKNTRDNYYCANYIKYGKRYCTSHHASATELEEMILSDLQQEIDSRSSVDKSTSNLKGRKRPDPLEKKIKIVEREIQLLINKMDKLLERNIEGIVKDELFKSLNEKYNDELNYLNSELERLKVLSEKNKQNEINENYLRKKFLKVKDIKKLPLEKQKAILFDLVEKITFNDGDVEIEYRF